MRDTLGYGDVKWVLRHLLTLRSGEWPDPEWSEPSPTRSQVHQAKFGGSCELAAVVELRLSMCGFDGFLVKQVYAWGESYDYLSQNLKLDRKKLVRGVQSSLAYITGKWPKTRDYKTHKAHFQIKGSK